MDGSTPAASERVLREHERLRPRQARFPAWPANRALKRWRLAITSFVVVAAIAVAATQGTQVQNMAGRLVSLVASFFTLPVDKSIAVLPFENRNEAGSADDYLGDGMAEDVTARLAARIGELRVISGFSTRRFRDGALPPAKIARQLGVDALLHGTIQRRGNDLRIFAQLTKAASGDVLWSEVYDRRGFEKIFDVQRDIAEHIVLALHSRLSPSRRSALERKPTASSQAYDLYLQGCAAYYRFHREDNERAINLFQQAAALDPNYALPRAALASAYCQRVLHWEYPYRWLEDAASVAREAVLVDPMCAEGYKALGMVAAMRGDYASDIELCHRALEINPNLVGPHVNIGDSLRSLGRFDEAIVWIRKAIALDPINPVIHWSLGDQYLFLMDDEAAERAYRKALSIDHNYLPARCSIVYLHLLQGHVERARAECAELRVQGKDENSTPRQLAALIEFFAGERARAAELYGELARENRRGGAREFYGSVTYLTALGSLKLQAGDTEAAKALLQEAAAIDEETIQARPGAGSQDYQYDLAAIQAALGQPERALASLRQSMENGLLDYRALRADPRFAPLATEHAFQNLLLEMKTSLERMRSTAAEKKPAGGAHASRAAGATAN